MHRFCTRVFITYSMYTYVYLPMHRDNAYTVSTVSTYIYTHSIVYWPILAYIINIIYIYFAVLIQVLTFYGHLSFCRYDPSRSTRQSIGPSSLPQTIVMPSRQLRDVPQSQVSNGSAKLASKVSSILSGEPMTSSDSLPKSSSGKTHYQSATLREPQVPASGTLESKLPQPLSCSLPSKHSKDEVRLYNCTNAPLVRICMQIHLALE